MKKKFYTNVVAIIAGAISAFLTSLILWPIVKVIFENFFHFFGEVSENAWKDDLIVSITIMLWFFISSLVGGVICTLFDANKGWGVLIISMALIISILIILTKGDIFPNPLLESILLMLMIPLGFIAGRWIGMKIKAKRAENRNVKTRSQDNSSSQHGTSS